MSTTQTLTVETENVTQRIPVEVLVTLLSNGERSDWERENEAANRRGGEPLSEVEESRFLSDLENGRRVMHWLHDLNRRPTVSFSDEVVDALGRRRPTLI